MKNLEILMDIDGVLAPLGAIDRDRALTIIDFHGWERLAFPDDLLNFLSDLQKDNRITITWSSTWEDFSNLVFDHTKDFFSPYLTFDSSKNDLWLKEWDLLNYINDRPKTKFLIIDDEIPDESKLPHLKNVDVIKTDPVNGLSKENIHFIEEWIEKETKKTWLKSLMEKLQK